MKTIQSMRYNKAKQEFKEQMDPSDLSRSFFVSPAGYVVGFNITRSDGAQLEYNAEENSYNCLPKDAPSGLDIRPEDGILDLPPYNYHLHADGPELYETHAFPDPSTNSIYETLRRLREEAGRSQFHIALAMTELSQSLLNENELPIIANKAAIMYAESQHKFSLIELTDAINDLWINGLKDYLIGSTVHNFDPEQVRKALLTSDQESFNTLVAHSANVNRWDLYSGSGLTHNNHTVLSEEMKSILPYLEQSADPKPLNDRIQNAQVRSQADQETKSPSKKSDLSRS